MTIRVGVNPSSGEMYVGLQSGSSLANRVASGGLTLSFSLTGTNVRHLFGSGTVDLPATIFQIIEQHPVFRRGPGTFPLGALSQSGTSSKVGRPQATGTIAPLLSIVGNGIRKPQADGDVALDLRFSGFAENNGQRLAIGDMSLTSIDLAGDASVTQYPTAAGDLPLGSVTFNGVGTVQLHVVASGDISLGALSVRDIAVGTTIQIIAIEGILLDPVLEGTFIDTINLEGAA